MKAISLVLLISVSGFLLSCNKNKEPEIVGCDRVSYKGTTYTIVGCKGGAISFDTQVTQSGNTASFHITCSGGCISSVTVK